MTKHLPECERWYVNMPAPDECPACEMFRACEQRTIRTWAIKVHEADQQGFREGIKEGRSRLMKEVKGSHKDAYREGRITGLDAAREAVMLHATAGQGASVPPREFVHTDSLLAAIDALRENP